jgi:FKBP-type peptidyl-prolyl cis-trans isomerase FkpA
MKLALLALILSAAPALAADAPKAEAPKAAAKAAPAAPKDPFKTDEERAFYTYGFIIARNLAPFNLTAAELKIVTTGITDAILGTTPKIDLNFFRPRVQEILTKRIEAPIEAEKAKGQAFTEKFVKENKPQPIPGGGWYLETKAGTGPMPTRTSVIKAHYRGTTIDGREFDSSYSRGVPYETSLEGGVIACWLNVFPLMKLGAKGKIVCPAEVAYGNQDKGPLIKPGATLLFDIELVEIVKP